MNIIQKIKLNNPEKENLQNTFFLSFCKLIPSTFRSGPLDLFTGKP